MTPVGLPHSETPGSQPATGSPRRFAGRRVLHRLPVPRHPPCALSILPRPLELQCSPRAPRGISASGIDLVFALHAGLPCAHLCCQRAAVWTQAGSNR